MKDTAAIIVAGGMGLRFGGKVRKQYLKLRGRPMIWWSLSAFEHSPSVSSIVLVVPAKDVFPVSARAKGWKIRKLVAVVSGGQARSDSVGEGLSAVPSGCRYVAVHDAVRPLVTPHIIESVIAAARKNRAALAATPSKDTVKLSNAQGQVLSTPSRDSVWLAQTPQVFERRLLERAHRLGHGKPVTDDAQLIERLGVRVKLVDSPPENIKVTVPMDFELARKIIGGRS